MTSALKIAIATINPTVGDIDGNATRILKVREETPDVDLIVYSELCLIGYPPEDLVLKPAFQRDAMDKTVELAQVTKDGGPAMLISSLWVEGGKLYNSSIMLDNGTIAAIRHKRDLPNYGVFDEKRVFSRGPCPEPVEFKGVKLGVLTCEDLWWEEVTEYLTNKHSDILVSLNGSPYDLPKAGDRLTNGKDRVTQSGLPLIYTNQVGGQDELVFDGEAFIMDTAGNIVMRQQSFVEETTVTNWFKGENGKWACSPMDVAEKNDRLTDIYQAMMIGVRDYVNKNRFPGVIIGMSGGVDSALSAIVAVDALGADRVHLVMMPSKYTSEESLIDASDAARMMGCSIDNIPINDAVEAFDKTLEASFAGTEADLTEENLQSRIRAIILMGISNKHGKMVLTTGNKSEMSVGYATLYGDMCGGYNALKDIYKLDVFKLCHWRNENHPNGGLGPRGQIMPTNIIEKPPTAELRPDQKDEDSLPPYEVLDDILECLIEKEMTKKDIVKRGHDQETVARIQHLLYIAEYKRRQSPPGVKISDKNFGRDRRYPITNGYRDKKVN
ncbi:NAD+ synthase [Pseudemcibacter aquimaris]|uniref:NAD+ synthase n=1 Tax=Pseudemcibacter aquimaris TaxID=2857064 RepID=UPI002011ADF2|nr:NAD+ synthase [Pseudemcibacter aquimaris]MCC3859650.1 NAD+ synthase [Pseudemcibacter aquimaris]WDU60045.1 NAD+ synthase [Pseudemcibacter aquimaris]